MKTFGFAALAAGTLIAASAAQAEIKGLEIMAPSGPGGGWDQTARAVQEVMTTLELANGVQVVNVPGAGGTVGLAQFITANKGRGDRLMICGFTLVSAPIVNTSPFDLDDVTPIARLTGDYEVIAVPASSKIASLDDLVTAMQTDPGAVSWAGGSIGSTDHVFAALFAQAIGVDPTKLNFAAHSGGGEVMTSLLGGHVTVAVSGWQEFEAQVAAGQLRALGIAAGERVEGVEVPTLIEQGVALELANWRGVVAPPGLDDAEIAALSDAVDQMVDSPQWADLVKSKNWLDYHAPRDDFAAFINAQQDEIGALLKSIGLSQ